MPVVRITREELAAFPPEVQAAVAGASPAGATRGYTGQPQAQPTAPTRPGPGAGGAGRRTSAPAPPPPPSPRRSQAPRAIPVARARAVAEAAAVDSFLAVRPLGGIVWASRAEGCMLRQVRGLLGMPAVWVYYVSGYVHAGWLVAGTIARWEAQVGAEDGRLLGLRFTSWE